MPFKDAAARAAYMKNYEAEYRLGKRRGDGPAGVSARTLKAREAAVKRRKALWFLQNKEWCADRLRARRRAAAEAEAAALLHVVSKSPTARGSAAGKATSGASSAKGAGSKRKHKPTDQRAA